MNSILQKVGILINFIVSPLTWLVIRNSTRTRILVINDNKLLVTKDWIGNGKWDLPGGGLHKNEDPKTGALRELKEETGLEVLPKDLEYIGDLQEHFNITLKLFRAKLIDEPITKRQAMEIAEIKWASMNSLNSTNSKPEIDRALSSLSSPVR
jgi:8-oxo-dGTP pyrophosphatase MutT (NUDIX family)